MHFTSAARFVFAIKIFQKICRCKMEDGLKTELIRADILALMEESKG